MSVTLSVTLRGPKMEGTWWGEDDPKSSCEVQGKLLDAEQATAAFRAELTSQDTTLLLGLRPQAHRSASRREAQAITETLKFGVPEASGGGGLAPMANGRSLSEGTAAGTATSAAGAAAAAELAHGPGSSAQSRAGATGSSGASSSSAAALPTTACSAWSVTFLMPPSPGGETITVNECFALAILPPDGWADGAGPSSLSSGSSPRWPVLGQGFNDFGAFIVEGEFDPQTGEVLAEKTYTSRDDHLRPAVRAAWGLSDADEADPAAEAAAEADRRAAKRVRDAELATARDEDDEAALADASADTKRLRLDATKAEPLLRAEDPAPGAGAEGAWVRASVLGAAAGALAGVVYEGETVDGLPHGAGTAVYGNGHMVEGRFRRGALHGWAVVTDGGDRAVFEGEFDGGAVTGFGRARLRSGDVYEGAWRRGLFHGAGRYCMVGGGSYEGGWADGVRQGNGVQVTADGTAYRGQWARGLRHGRGTLTTAAGDVYDGEWAADAPEGRGRLVRADGTGHSGEFRGGLPHGAGVAVGPAGELRGRWAAGVPAGTVTLRQEEPARVLRGEWRMPATALA